MIAVLALSAPALSACGGGGGGSATTTCSPSGQALHVTAQNGSFDRSCYAVRSGQPFTIDFDNKDIFAHNFAIYTDSTASKALLKPTPVANSMTVYHGTALHSGTYYFQCDIHTNMHGTFIVK
jgi:plastocyanin